MGETKHRARMHTSFLFYGNEIGWFFNEIKQLQNALSRFKAS